MQPFNQPNFILANTVLNANINSQALQLAFNGQFGIQITFTGTPNGTFKLQSSCDQVLKPVAENNGRGLPTNWTDVANSTFSVNAAGNVEWDYAWPGYNWVRVVYTDASGGTSTAVIASATFNNKGY